MDRSNNLKTSFEKELKYRLNLKLSSKGSTEEKILL
jgi:hypothetical protein